MFAVLRASSIRLSLILGLLLVLTLPLIAQEDEGESELAGGVVNIYSARHYGAIELPFQEFTDETGIQVRVSQGSPRALLERLRAEGEFTPADILLAIDAGVLDLAASEGLLQAVESETLTDNIDETQRDPDNHWFGLSQRVRTAVYNPANVSEEEIATLETYADLADEQWAGRLCMRPGSHIYTVSLVSSLIYHEGEESAEAIVAGWVANDPTYINSDTRQIQAVAAGECDVAVVNHYYMGRLTAQDDPAAEATELLWLNQETTGTFYNINGAGVTANATNRAEAVAFIEWMSTLEGQAGDETGFPGSNYEFPTNFNAEPNPIIASFGEVMLDFEYPLWEYGDHQQAAVDLMERVGYGFDES